MNPHPSIKLKEAIANRNEYISIMAQWDDKKLSKHIDLFQQQMQKAYNDKNEAAYLLLSEYENQTIEARDMKNFQ